MESGCRRVLRACSTRVGKLDVRPDSRNGGFVGFNLERRLTDVSQHDLLPQLQVHLPDQGAGHVRQAVRNS
jgi:hypothetical protein